MKQKLFCLIILCITTIFTVGGYVGFSRRDGYALDGGGSGVDFWESKSLIAPRITCQYFFGQKFEVFGALMPGLSIDRLYFDKTELGFFTGITAGLGAIGKSSLLLNPRYGNMLTLGALLTDLDLPSDPVSENICKDNCLKCIDNCPVGAIENGRVNQKLCRNNTYGKTQRGFDTVDCNRCRTVCPMNIDNYGNTIIATGKV